MPEFGFISDKLEIKFLILYIAARVAGSVPFETLQDLAMCDGGVDYFGFSACLADLVSTEHLTLDGQGLYAITDKGRRNSAICESSLPLSVRGQVDQNLVDWNERIRRQALVGAQVEERGQGGYAVRLSLSDELDQLMELRLLVTRRELAKEMQNRFRDNAEGIYAAILALLCGQEEQS